MIQSMKFKFPDYVKNIVCKLMEEPTTISIWLVGSRANGTEREDSDWDILTFVEEDVSPRDIRDDRVDVIKVDLKGNYLLEGQNSYLIGSFDKWGWRDLGCEKANYSVRRTPSDIEKCEIYDLSDVKIETLNGYKIWARKA